MIRQRPNVLRRYGFAGVIVLLATLARLLLNPMLGPRYPYVTFFVAVIVTAWYGGLGPALLPLVMGCLATVFAIIPPAHTGAAAITADLMGMALYFFVGLTSAFLSEARWAAQHRAEVSAEDAREKQQELEQEIEERRRAEEALQFLAEASSILASSLDYQATLDRLAELAVPRLADWCVVHMRQADGAVEMMAAVHREPSRRALLRKLLERYPPEPDAPHGFPRVLRTGEPELIAEVPEALLQEAARDPTHLKLLRELGLRSNLCVPLRARGHILGTISLATAESGRTYGPAAVTLAQEIARRAGVAIDNARLYQELQEADHQKDLFLAMLGHELRTPLGTIQNTLSLLPRRAGGDRELERLWQRVERQARKMSRLIDDLQDVARINSGKVGLHREPLDLRRLVHQTLDDLRASFEDAALALTCEAPDEPLIVDGDPLRLAQVMSNLLTNAIKFTDPGGKISVRLSGCSRTGMDDGRPEAPDGWAVLQVRDSGVGIEPAMLPHVFDSFTQAEPSLDRSRGGLGLGLALVKGLVDLHHGQVDVASAGLGHGAEFTVRLPLAGSLHGRNNEPDP
jgi:signal transduction histidine kinase